MSKRKVYAASQLSRRLIEDMCRGRNRILPGFANAHGTATKPSRGSLLNESGELSAYSPMDGVSLLESGLFNYRDFEVRHDQRDHGMDEYFHLPFYYPFSHWCDNPGLLKTSRYLRSWTHNTRVFHNKRDMVEASIAHGFEKDMRLTWGLCAPSKSEANRKAEIYQRYHSSPTLSHRAHEKIITSRTFDESRWACAVDMNDAQDDMYTSIDSLLIAGEPNGELSYSWSSKPFKRSTSQAEGSVRAATLDLVKRAVAQRWLSKGNSENYSCGYTSKCELLTASPFKRVGKGKYKIRWSNRNELCQSFPQGLEDMLYRNRQNGLNPDYVKMLRDNIYEDGSPEQLAADLNRPIGTAGEALTKDIMRWYGGTFKLKTYTSYEIQDLIERVGKYSFQSAHHLVEVVRGKRTIGVGGYQEWHTPLSTDAKTCRIDNEDRELQKLIRKEDLRKLTRDSKLGIEPNLDVRSPRFRAKTGMWADQTAWFKYVKTGEYPDSFEIKHKMLVTLENEHGSVILVGYSPYEQGIRDYYKQRSRIPYDRILGVPVNAGPVRFRINQLRCWKPYGKTITPALETKDGECFAYGRRHARIQRSTQPNCPNWLFVLSDTYRDDPKDGYCFGHYGSSMVKPPNTKYRYPTGIKGYSLCDPVEHNNVFFHLRKAPISNRVFTNLKGYDWKPTGGIMVPAYVPIGIPSFAFDASPREILKILLKELDNRMLKFSRAKKYLYDQEVFVLLSKTFWFAKSFGGLWSIFEKEWSMKRIETFCSKVFWMGQTKVRPYKPNTVTQSCVPYTNK